MLIDDMWCGRRRGKRDVSTRFSLSVENEWADAGWDGRTRLARHNLSGANGDRDKNIFPFQLTTSRIDDHYRLINTLLKLMTILLIHTY